MLYPMWYRNLWYGVTTELGASLCEPLLSVGCVGKIWTFNAPR